MRQFRVTLNGTGGELASVVVTPRIENQDFIQLSEIAAEVESEDGTWLVGPGDTLVVEEIA